jgi:hypothetical protein
LQIQPSNRLEQALAITQREAKLTMVCVRQLASTRVPGSSKSVT